jgi:putative iron-dependent peroxidase
MGFVWHYCRRLLMANPQGAIIPEPHETAFFLILQAVPERTNDLRRTATRVPRLTAELTEIAPEARLVSAVGFGPQMWDRLSPHKRPKQLRPFEALAAGGRVAPSTGGDLLLHIVSRRHDLNFELAMRIRHELGDAAQVLDEIHGFRYLDGRDLTGFIDGTENPKGDAERAEVALIGDEDADFAGGSYAFTQRYLHNLEKWAKLTTAEQEQAIGRRKSDSAELPAKIKPATAHISRVVIEENGEELEIVRHGFPYGTVSEAGAVAEIEDVPEEPGVYVFARSFRKKVVPLYVGETGNLRSRLTQHLKGNVRLMKGIQNAPNGRRIFLFGEVQLKRGQNVKKVCSVLQRALIKRALSEGHDLLNDRGAKIPYIRSALREIATQNRSLVD